MSNKEQINSNLKNYINVMKEIRNDFLHIVKEKQSINLEDYGFPVATRTDIGLTNIVEVKYKNENAIFINCDGIEFDYYDITDEEIVNILYFIKD